MAEFYTNFEDFMEKNKSVFDFIGKPKNKGHLLKKGGHGIFKAIWDARQGEIDVERNKLTSLNQLKSATHGKEIERLKKFIGSLETRLVTINKEIDALHEENGILVEKGKKFENDLVKSKGLELSKKVEIERLCEKIQTQEEVIKKGKITEGKLSSNNIKLKRILKTARAEKTICALDAEQLREEVALLNEEISRIKGEKENLKNYIENYKVNSIVLQEEADKSKNRVQKVLEQKRELIERIKLMKEKNHAIGKKLQDMAGEKIETVHHNNELQKRLINEKENIRKNSDEINHLNLIIEKNKVHEEKLKNKILMSERNLELEKKHVEKLDGDLKSVKMEKENLKKEIGRINTALADLGHNVGRIACNNVENPIITNRTVTMDQ